MFDKKNLQYTESLQKLTEIKDRIVSFWHWHSMDDARRNLWIGDTQELYYQLLTAFDLHKQNLREGKPDYRAVQLTLGSAKSRLEQVLSELVTVNHHTVEELHTELTDAFDDLWKPLAIEAGIQELLSKKSLETPAAPVIEISGDEYHLTCAICGEIAFIFRTEIPHHCDEQRLIFKGITHTSDITLKYSRAIFKLLKKNNIRKAHELLQQFGIEDGIDAFCPECNQIFCHGHFHLKELWEEGFYDCTVGTCPNGHRRVVDD